MAAQISNHSKLVATLLALAAAVVAAVVIAGLSGSDARSIQAPPAVAPPASQVAPQPAGVTVHRSSRKRVIVQSGRSVKGRSVTAKGKPGESVSTGQPGGKGGSAKGGAGGSASAEGGSATSGSVKIQTDP